MRSTARSMSSTRPWCCTPRTGWARTMSRPCCRPADRHGALRLQVDDDGSGGLGAERARTGIGAGRAIVSTASTLLNRGDGGALTAGSGRRADAAVRCGRDRPVGVDHPPPGGGRGVVANPVGGHQHRLGAASQWPADRAADRGTSFARWSKVLEGTPTHRGRRRAESWRQVTAAPPAVAGGAACRDTYASAGQLSVSLDADTTRRCSVRCPPRSTLGCRTSC